MSIHIYIFIQIVFILYETINGAIFLIEKGFFAIIPIFLIEK